jgi:HAAS
MSKRGDALVAEYLDRLEDELGDAPGDVRREVVQEIGEHITAARAELDDESEADVRNLLERLGDPADIAAESGGRTDAAASPRSGWREVLALILLPIGGVVLPVFGWVAGVVLLWLSDAWTARDKVVGTLVLPGGLLIPLGLLVLGTSESGMSCPIVPAGAAGSSTPVAAPAPGTDFCTSTGGTSLVLVALFIVLLRAPVATDAYLAGRLNRR